MFEGVCVGGPKHRQRAAGHNRTMAFASAPRVPLLHRFPDLEDKIEATYTVKHAWYRAETFRVKGVDGFHDFTIWVADGVTVEDAVRQVFARAQRQRKRGYGTYLMEFSNREALLFYQPRGPTLAEAVQRVMKKFCRKPRKHGKPRHRRQVRSLEGPFRVSRGLHAHRLHYP